MNADGNKDEFRGEEKNEKENTGNEGKRPSYLLFRAHLLTLQYSARMLSLKHPSSTICSAYRLLVSFTLTFTYTLILHFQAQV